MRIIVGTRKGVFIVARENGAWSIVERHFLGDHANLVAHDPRDNTLYACLDHGHFGTKIHRSDDDGANWSEIAAPTYPDPPEGHEEPVNPFSGNATPWSLKKIWSLVPSFADRPGELWCGTIPGGLFKSTDRGESWEIVRSLWDDPARLNWMGGGEDYAGIHSILLDPRTNDRRRITIGVSIGGVWRSDDEGNTWSITGKGMIAEYLPPEEQENPHAQDVHLIAHAPADPDTIWTQHHNGVFLTRDAADSWEQVKDITPAHFGFPVTVHPTDGNTAWLVPAIKDEKRIPVDGKVVVNRTRDGGKTWETLRDGLPQDDAYDLTFRHSFDVHGDGDVVAFGSTTGSLWVSEDQGDNWATISKNLPPVYCVQFAS